MVATGFSNSFTSGEISEDAWDRTDLQPIAHGCEAAINYVIRIPGPLGKRRGFWKLGDVIGPNPSRMIPFRRSIDDALMLEFGHLIVKVWNNDGSPLLNAGTPFTFASPYTAAQLPNLRFKQVGDVIYIRSSDGLAPQALNRLTNTSWSFAVETFPNGPWRNENIDTTKTVTVNAACELDANNQTSAGCILASSAINLTANFALFDSGMVGSYWRLRQNDGAPSVKSWAVGYQSPVGYYCLSEGYVYKCDVEASGTNFVTNPPMVTSGTQSDGGNLWEYRHDGAGVVQITAVTDAEHATGTVIATVPLANAQSTSCFSEGAYSNYRGWPTMWPALREERLVEGSTTTDLDFLDLTESAGFSPTSENFIPGLGTGAVIATDAIRRRIGTDGAELIWAMEATYLLVGSATGEYLVAGSVLDEPLSPTSVVVKNLSDFGSAAVYPVKAHTGVLFVARDGQTLRELAVDTAQNSSGDDLSVLAKDITSRGIVQLAWVPLPDEALWLRLADGGLALMTYHKEQQVRGFTRVALPGGFIVEDMAVLPGPSRLDTLWIMVSRTKNGGVQRHLWMLSQTADGLFGMDCADFYEGAPVTTISGLDQLDGEAVRVLADGGEVRGLTVAGGQITLPVPASKVMVGLPWQAQFKSLKLDTQLGGSIGQRQRVAACIVSLKTAGATVGLDGAQLTEKVMPRTPADIPTPMARPVIQECAIAGDTGRDPRIVIVDDSAYDGVIYSLRPKVVVGG